MEALIASPGASRSAFYVTCFAVALVLALAGFWPSYFGPLFKGTPVRPVMQTWVIPFHAAFFTGWLVGVLVQACLVWRGRTDLHRKFGIVLATCGTLGVIVGSAVALAMPLRRISLGGAIEEEVAFMFAGVMDMMMFAAFLWAAILLRNKAEAHKRLMVLATLTIMLVGYGRFVGYAASAQWLEIRWLATFLYSLPLWLVIAYDLSKQRRIHMVYLIGIPVFMLKVNQDLVMQSQAWRSIGVDLLRPFLS